MKKSSRRQEPKTRYWRPDFRDRERLPDIKTVRTEFFVNVIAVALVVVVGILVGVRELSVLNLSSSIDEIRQDVALYRAENEAIVEKNREFRENMLKIQEVVEFTEAKVKVSDLIIDVASALSHGMAFGKFEYSEEGARFEGTISSEVDSDNALNGFIAGLKNIQSLTSQFSEISQSSVIRHPETGDVDFVVEIGNVDEKDSRRRKR